MCRQHLALLSIVITACGDPSLDHEADSRDPSAIARPGDLRRWLGEHEIWRKIPYGNDWSYAQFSSVQRGPYGLPGLLAPLVPVIEKQFDIIANDNKDFNNVISRCRRQPLLLQNLDGVESCERDGAGNYIEGYTIASVEQPGATGAVSRIWLTTLDLSKQVNLLGLGSTSSPYAAEWDNEVIKVYTGTPLTLAGVFSPRKLEWSSLRADAEGIQSLLRNIFKATVSYWPIAFRDRLRVVLDNASWKKAYYYHVNVQKTQSEHAFDGDAKDITALVTEQQGPTVERYGLAASGEVKSVSSVISPSAPMGFSESGPGALTYFEISITDRTPSLEELAGLRLKLSWDRPSTATPTIDIPLPAFFGCLSSLSGVETLPLTVKVEGPVVRFSSSLPMPFRKNARVMIESSSATAVPVTLRYSIDRSGVSNDAMYFRVAQAVTRPSSVESAEHVAVDLLGRGKYVGTVSNIRGVADNAVGPRSRDPFNFLEGDETFLVDGRAEKGTGTEDYFNGAFYFSGGVFDHEFSAVTQKKKLPGDGAEITAQRWHLFLDEINFDRAFRLSFEYGMNRPAVVEHYHTVSYYYTANPW